MRHAILPSQMFCNNLQAKPENYRNLVLFSFF